MSKVKNENYYVVQGFMVNEMHLKGNELSVFAIIYGFSQEENQWFNGSLQYLADWTGATKQGILKNLKSLIDKEFIIKQEKLINNVKVVEYKECYNKFNSIKQSLTGYSTEFNGGIKQSLTNNIDNNINNNKERINKKEKTIAEQLKEQPEEIKPVLLKFLEMRNKIKKPMTDYAFKLLLNKLEKLSGGFNGNKILILNQSIIRCWQDIFKVKIEELDYFNKDLVDYAREVANGKGDRYVLAILNDWKQQGIETVELAKKSNELFIKGVGNQNKDKTVLHDRKYTKEDISGLFCDIDDIEI